MTTCCKTSWREDCLSGRQECQETSDCGRSEKALGALAPSVGNRRALRSSLRHTSACRAAAGSLTREARWISDRHRGGEDYWHSDNEPKESGRDGHGSLARLRFGSNVR